ncbi:MAG TPA: type VI secretion system tube protein Hcp [Solirubrobacteraceae bacterium]|nr:type VI secretion system tube protein Hcp [Solirubrobacteraceae bacterium]
MIALQRSAGNASALALLRRASDVANEAPITLTLPGVVDGAAVSTWSIFRGDSRRPATEVELTRPTDANSPRLAKAMMEGAPAVTATLVVRKLSPLGWIAYQTVTFENCMITSFDTHGEYDSVWLRFARMDVGQ